MYSLLIHTNKENLESVLSLAVVYSTGIDDDSNSYDHVSDVHIENYEWYYHNLHLHNDDGWERILYHMESPFFCSDKTRTLKPMREFNTATDFHAYCSYEILLWEPIPQKVFDEFKTRFMKYINDNNIDVQILKFELRKTITQYEYTELS